MDETKLVYISLKLEKLAQLNSSPSWKSKTGKIRIERQIREDLEAILSNTNIITFNVLEQVINFKPERIYFIHSHNLGFNTEQILALLPDQRKHNKPATVRNKVQEIMESPDPVMDSFIPNFLGNSATLENINLTGLLSQFDVTTIELSTQMYPTIAYARVVLLGLLVNLNLSK
ncbi:11669_t:CDS:2 [Entrophospora sp. SA101]|nr:11669_t:CDS:2 [Entrophospora sp. SA101]